MDMPLRSLVFSSDTGTARMLGQALAELGMQVEHCPEIFGAVEQLTLQSFDVLVVDWNDEPEASFLLRAARDLKSNEPPFPVAVVEAQASVNEALRAGANQVLVKNHAPANLVQFHDFDRGFVETAGNARPNAPTGDPARGLRKSDASEEISHNQRVTRLATLSFAGYAALSDRRRPRSLRQPSLAVRAPGRIYRSALVFAATAAIFASMWQLRAFARPGFGSGIRAAISISTEQVRGRMSLLAADWQKSEANEDVAEASLPEQIFVTRDRVRPQWPAAKPSPVPPALAIAPPPATPLATTGAAAPPQSVAAEDAASAYSVVVPDSLKHAPQLPSARTVVASLTPTLLGALEPVLIPEEVSRKLLLQKIQPSYPAQALRAGLQGSVVLRAWIGRDGKIRDLKLMQGYLVLGRAAFEAVKQWRYQPYYLNGQAMETETLITVDFAPASLAQRNN